MEADCSNIDKGFSALYDEYETLAHENYIDIARRNTIRKHVETFLQPQYSILEINAGSGIDAVYFARKGHTVLATDIASGAEKHIRDKITGLGLSGLEFQNCSFLALGQITGRTFDHIFSNYGGLNCTNNLPAVFAQLGKVLNVGGYVSLVIMPPYYPWEMATILKGNRKAFRRWHKKGVAANVGSYEVTTFYHTPKKVKAAAGNHFRHVKTRNIGTFYPSSHFASISKYKSIVSGLIRLDDRINDSPLMWKGIGDYFIITFQKTD